MPPLWLMQERQLLGRRTSVTVMLPCWELVRVHSRCFLLRGRMSRTVSVPRQDAYRPLVEVAREQPEFEFSDIEGSMVGFWTPGFMQSVAVPGYHLHFLTADKRHGGHLLECRPRQIRISLQHIARLELGLPLTLDYLTAYLDRDTSADLKEAEH